ncbi:MAG: biotin/lipoyl-binding protein, partial [Bacteroidota bacterium]
MKRSIIISLSIVLLALILTSCGKQVQETQPIRKDVTETVFAAGALEAEGMYQLTARTSGYLTELHFDEGQIVEEGAVLAVIENNENIINTQGATQLLDIAKSNTEESAPQLRQAEYDIRIKEQQMKQDQKTAERYQRLWESNSIARVEYENAQLAYEASQSKYQSAVEQYKRLSRDAVQQVVNNQTSVNIYSTAKGKNQVKAVIRGKVYKQLKEQGDYVNQGE